MKIANGIWVSSTATAIASRVSYLGGNDIESWGTPGPAESWADGWDGTTTGLYLNFGSADGCPSGSANNGTCNNGYTQYDYFKLSWGNPNAIVEPQIYFYPSGNDVQAQQWKQICLYGHNTQGKTIQFQGPLTEYYADSTSDNPGTSWSQLWNQLNGTACAQTPLFETSMKWQS